MKNKKNLKNSADINEWRTEIKQGKIITLEGDMKKYILENAMVASMGIIGESEDEYRHVEFRIVVNPNGRGYIHIIGEDCETPNFDLRK